MRSALGRDAVLAARVLEVANSVAYSGGKTRTANIDEAVTKIGFAAVQNIVAKIGIFDAFPPEGADGFNALRGWQHSFAVAALMERLGVEPGAEPENVAHLVGLCHDLSKLILRQLFSEEYSHAAALAVQTGRPLRDMEAEIFGAPRTELVAEVLGGLGLPKEIVTPIQEFLALDEGQGEGEPTRMVRMLQVANSYAHGLMLATSIESRVRPFARSECREILGVLNPDSLDSRRLCSDVLTLTHLLAKLPASESAKLSKPLLEQQRVRVWYARHRTFVLLDPVAQALTSISRATASERLPERAGDLDRCSGLVASAPRLGASPLAIQEIDAMRRALNRPDLPCLVLVGEAGETAPEVPSGMVVRQYPVTLGFLAEWISNLARQ